MFGFGVKSVSIDELAEKLAAGKQVLIDVREPNEYAAGHVPGAVNIPLRQLASKVDKLDPNAETYLICRSGARSANATSMLKRAGFAHVYNVRGGTMSWRGKLAR